MNKTLILGAGEIGKSLGEVLAPYYEITFLDKDGTVEGQFDIINICYPYSDKFVEITREYIKKYQPKLTIIHSTVPVGTTSKLGKGVVHSPVNGKHPNLAQSIKTFVKFVGGVSGEDVFLATDFLKKAGIRVAQFATPGATELAKMMCTTYYGWNIVFMKEMVKECEKYGVPFHEAYTLWNNAYNEGYEKMGDVKFNRPVLLPMKGTIGGHCVIPNCHLIKNDITEFILSKEKENDLSPRKKRNSNR